MIQTNEITKGLSLHTFLSLIIKPRRRRRRRESHSSTMEEEKQKQKEQNYRNPPELHQNELQPKPNTPSPLLIQTPLSTHMEPIREPLTTSRPYHSNAVKKQAHPPPPQLKTRKIN